MIRSLYRRLRNRLSMQKALREGLIVLDSGVTVGSNFSFKFQGSRRPQLKVGKNTHLDGRFVVRGDGYIEIGSHCSFRQDTYIGSVAGIAIEDHVFGAEGVFIVDNNNHPVDPGLRRSMTLTPMGSPAWSWTTEGVAAAPIVIRQNVWLGRNCAVLKGVEVGMDCVVALGAIVTRTIPAGSVAAGNPARVVKSARSPEIGEEAA